MPKDQNTKETKGVELQNFLKQRIITENHQLSLKNGALIFHHFELFDFSESFNPSKWNEEQRSK